MTRINDSNFKNNLTKKYTDLYSSRGKESLQHNALLMLLETYRWTNRKWERLSRWWYIDIANLSHREPDLTRDMNMLCLLLRIIRNCNWKLKQSNWKNFFTFNDQRSACALYHLHCTYFCLLLTAIPIEILWQNYSFYHFYCSRLFMFGFVSKLNIFWRVFLLAYLWYSFLGISPIYYKVIPACDL